MEEALREARTGADEGGIPIGAALVDGQGRLVATDEDYAAQLSEVSVESLRLQGGPMSPGEVEAFRESANWQSKVRVRIWDDRAKTPGTVVPGLESYRELLTAHLSRQQEGG